MNNVDRLDQLMSYYSFLRRSVKWWRKVLFWLLEVAVVNEYILYMSGSHVRKPGQEAISPNVDRSDETAVSVVEEELLGGTSHSSTVLLVRGHQLCAPGTALRHSTQA